MSNLFAVVGQHRDDPDHLLLQDDDGQHYDLRLTDGATVPVEPDDRWSVDQAAPVFDEEDDES